MSATHQRKEGSTRTEAGARSLRIWPAAVLVSLQWGAWIGLSFATPGFEGFQRAGLAGLAFGLLLLLWWTFASRAPRIERWGGSALLIGAVWLTLQVLDRSWLGGGGAFFLIHAVPPLCLAFFAWACLVRRPRSGQQGRLWTLPIALVVALAPWTLVRSDGLRDDHVVDLAWRWAETAEERLLASADPTSPGAEVLPASSRRRNVQTPESAPVWPGFRGAGRDAVVRGLRIGTDWGAAPPRELWRRPVGPGWGSCAVGGGLVFTQEQRGDEEIVSAYRLEDGAPVWRHSDPTRFWESNSGAGPRATPSLAGGVVFAVGATGRLNALDAASGRGLWARDLGDDAEKQVPDWGFSASPVVIGDPEGDQVVVAAAGRLLAYDAASGALRWRGPDGGGGYGSPQPATLGGVSQVLLAASSGVTALDPVDGSVLWEHRWPGFAMTQPVPTDDGVLVGNHQSGTRRLTVEKGSTGWSAEERWTSHRLKPYFNGFAVHEGHAYGFDGRILASIDLATGARNWKGGRYGNGQLLLLADQDLLLVLGDDGTLAAVGATPERFVEHGAIQVLHGKTWNHPALAGDLLLVRNGEEMAALRLPDEL